MYRIKNLYKIVLFFLYKYFYFTCVYILDLTSIVLFTKSIIIIIFKNINQDVLQDK